MENENTYPVYALTKRHEEIVDAIYTSAGVCLPENFAISEQEPPVRWVKALWDTGATNSSISDRLASDMQMPFEDYVYVATAMGTARVPHLPNSFVFTQSCRFRRN